MANEGSIILAIDTTKQPVHPRVCGEHIAARCSAVHKNGSSPRVRGTLKARPGKITCDGFIPACAGNTVTHYSRWSGNTVHPRVCGEHSAPAPTSMGVPGSSPRVRGTLRRRVARRNGQRFIPACAGNTGSSARWHCLQAVHPRVCGEHIPPGRMLACYNGSSPRVRGTHCSNACDLWWYRFIPACAGNTILFRTSRHSPTVHPRVCGEH